MSRLIWPFLFMLCLTVRTPARAESPRAPIAPQQGVVLLRNGQAITGKITQAGDEYYVTLPSGEIHLTAAQVDLVCRDVAEGYERKRAKIDADKAPDHLELALWCTRQKLYEEAAGEIAAAREIAPRNPRIALVERQLRLAQEAPTHADYKSASAAGMPSNEDLDRLVRGMPLGTVETFTNTIQPLLLNTCTTSGCHGPQSEGSLRLLRIQSGKTFSRRFTQRNLHTVLNLIDRTDPTASPLLTAPVAPHGTAKAAIFTNKEVTQYRQLLQWVMRVAEGPATELPATVDTPDDHLSQQLPRGGRGAVPVNALFVDPSESAMPGAGEGTRLLDRAAKKPQPAPMPTNDEPPADPFDPEVFNQQFLPQP